MGRVPRYPTPKLQMAMKGDGLEALCWLVRLLGMELACLAGPDELDGVLKRGGPIEPMEESLLDEGPR